MDGDPYESIKDMAEAPAGELEVRGAELVLRYAHEDDAPALYELASNPDVSRR